MTIALLALFFPQLFFPDSKYKTPPPYGRDGVIVLDEADFAGLRPLFLIDGWLLTDARARDLPTFIGSTPTSNGGLDRAPGARVILRGLPASYSAKG